MLDTEIGAESMPGCPRGPKSERPTKLETIDRYHPDDVSAFRRTLDDAIVRQINRILLFFAEHWLAIFNLGLGVISTLPFLAPYLASIGQEASAGALYFFYHVVAGCHQMPERSFFLWGHKMAYCQRDAAIYSTVFLAGVGYAFVRTRLKPLAWRLYVFLIAPLVVDGTLQLIGFYESTWEARVFTGVLFGAATVWLMYPRIEIATVELRHSLRRLLD